MIVVVVVVVVAGTAAVAFGVDAIVEVDDGIINLGRCAGGFLGVGSESDHSEPE